MVGCASVAMPRRLWLRTPSLNQTHTAEVVREVNENRETIIITQNGEARAIIQDIATYEQTQESLALLKLFAQGKRNIEDSRSRGIHSVDSVAHAVTTYNESANTLTCTSLQRSQPSRI